MSEQQPVIDEMKRPVTMTLRALETMCWLSGKFGRPTVWDLDACEATWFLEDPDEVEAADYVELRYGGDVPTVDVMCSCDRALLVIGYCAMEGIAYRTAEQIIAAWKAEDEAAGGAGKRTIN